MTGLALHCAGSRLVKKGPSLDLPLPRCTRICTQESDVPQVSVTIAGRVYQLACGEGEEARLEQLAKVVDAKTTEIREAFGQIGDQRIAVMAALTLADELGEATRRLAAAQDELERVEAGMRELEVAAAAQTRVLTHDLDDAALRIEQIAQALNPASRG